MKTQSVNILNDADEFERRMNWQLFASEQESVLWGGAEEDENGGKTWRPGDSLWPMPRGHFYGEQTVRRMIQEFDTDNDRSSRCEKCDVWWIGPDPCFECGENV